MVSAKAKTTIWYHLAVSSISYTVSCPFVSFVVNNLRISRISTKNLEVIEK